ncbi:MAG: hypothetical protein MJ072_03170, partial [Clostridia bacterium]|nr:hypothetical protein [Clostridia bacterium]
MLKDKRFEKYSAICYAICLVLIISVSILLLFPCVSYRYNDANVGWLEYNYTGYKMLAVPFLAEEVAKVTSNQLFFEACYYVTTSYCYLLMQIMSVVMLVAL